MGELGFINERVRDDNYSFLWCSCYGFEFLDARFDLERTSYKMKNKLKNMKKFFDLCFIFSFFICVVVIWVCVCV